MGLFSFFKGIGGRLAGCVIVVSAAWVAPARANVVTDSDVQALQSIGTDLVHYYDSINQLSAGTISQSKPLPTLCADSLVLDVRPFNIMVNDLFDLYYTDNSARDSDDDDMIVKIIAYRIKLDQATIETAIQDRTRNEGVCASVPDSVEKSRRFREILERLKQAIATTGARLPADTK